MVKIYLAIVIIQILKILYFSKQNVSKTLKYFFFIWNVPNQWRIWGINDQDISKRKLNKLNNTFGSGDFIQLSVTLGQLRRPQPYIKKRKNKITIIAKKTNAGKLEQG